MLLPPAMRDQDRQPSNPFGARKPRPDEVNQTAPEPWRVVNGIATIAGRKRTELPEPTPQHISDHDMIMRDLPMGGRLSKFCQQWLDETLDALIAGLAGFSTLKEPAKALTIPVGEDYFERRGVLVCRASRTLLNVHALAHLDKWGPEVPE